MKKAQAQAAKAAQQEQAIDKVAQLTAAADKAAQLAAAEALAKAAKAERMGVNAVCRALIEQAKAAEGRQAAALLDFVGRKYEGRAEDLKAAALEGVKAVDLLKAFKTWTPYVTEDGQAARLVRDESGAELWTVEAVQAFNERSIFFVPFRRKLMGAKPDTLKAAATYTKAGRKLVEVSSGRAAELRKAAKEAAAAK